MKGQLFKSYIINSMEKYTDALYQDFKDDELRSKILSNRAYINSVLKNYGKVIDDCMVAINLNPNFLKPYYRACKAYLSLDKYELCIKLGETGLQIENNKEILEMVAEAKTKLS